jgi:hypothetical protein
VALRASAGKAIGFDEDYGALVGAEPRHSAQNRIEAWESLLGGCATYDHLDFTFTPEDPTGSAAGVLPAAVPRERFDGRALRRQFSHVARYAAELDLASLLPDLVGVQQTPEGTSAVAMRVDGDGRGNRAAAAGSRDGGRIVVYLADSRRPFDAGFGETALGGALSVGGASPESRYDVRALDPQSGQWTDLPSVVADSRGALVATVPGFWQDVLIDLLPRGRGAA